MCFLLGPSSVSIHRWPNPIVLLHQVPIHLHVEDPTNRWSIHQPKNKGDVLQRDCHLAAGKVEDVGLGPPSIHYSDE